jgi:hypothetical protein
MEATNIEDTRRALGAREEIPSRYRSLVELESARSLTVRHEIRPAMPLACWLMHCPHGRRAGSRQKPQKRNLAQGRVVRAVRMTGRKARLALAFLGVSGGAVPAPIVMVMLFPVVAVPVAMAVPIAVALPAGCDDGGRRRDHDSTGDTHVNTHVDVCSMCGTGQADCSGGERQLRECVFLHGTVPQI